MFEGQVAYYLSKYLGQYVNGLDAESLKISVWRGDVELRNLSLKPEALQSLDLPIRVKAGLLGRLTIKVPWTKLGKEPVIVEFDRLYILAGPYSGEGKADAQNPEDWASHAEKSEQDGKMERVRAAEMDWIQELEAKAATKDGSGSSSSPSAPYMTIQSMIDPILGNLQLRLTNLHIRYEDEGSYPGHRLCLGLLLRKVSAHSVDEAGRKAFVTANALQCLRKAVALHKLAMYFDVDANFMEPPTHWEDLSPAQWDALFMPGGIGEGSGSHTGTHEYLVHPVSGDMMYTRRSKKFRAAESDPKQNAVLALESVALQYSRPQYAGTQALLTMLDTYQANAPYRFMKPKCRPRAGANSRVWWNYAARAVLRQQHGRGGGMAWSELQRYCSARKRYVPLYVKCLQSKQMGGDATIAEMDRQLGEGTILLFRRLAHAKVEVDKLRNAGAVSRQQDSSKTWVGWLTGSNAKAGAAAPSDTSDVVVGADEWKRFEDLLGSQSTQKEDDGSHDTPWTVCMQLQLQIAIASLKLVDDSHAAVLTTSMHALEVAVLNYPQTTSLAVTLGKAGVITPMGPLLSTGLLASQQASVDEAEVLSKAQLQPLQGSAFRLQLVQQPQDGSADACLSLELAPSYVTYEAAAIERVTGFFATSQALDLTALQAQVAFRALQLQKVATLRLKALSEATEKPKLILSLAMHAPKVAIPDTEGRCTLIADLGLFHLTSARTAPASHQPALTTHQHALPHHTSNINPTFGPSSIPLTPEEAALYERFSLSIGSMSAALIDGPFAWPSDKEQQLHQARASGPAGMSARAAGVPNQQRGDGRERGGSSGSSSINSSRLPDSLSLTELLQSKHNDAERHRDSTVVPLLDRFQMCVGLEVATTVHPRLPQFRAHVHADPIQLHVSPFRLHRLLNIAAALSPSSPDGDEGGLAGSATPRASDDAAGSKPIWVTDAEFQTKALVLAWEGITGSQARWQARTLTVWRGRLYISRGPDDGDSLESRSYWQDDRVMDLPQNVFASKSGVGVEQSSQDSCGRSCGTSHLVALVPSHVDRASAAEHPDALVMQLPDGATAAAMRRALLRSKAMMAAVAGLLTDGGDMEGDGSVGVSEDVFGFLLKHKDIITLSGTLAEVSLQISCRAPETWHSRDASAARSGARHSAGGFTIKEDQPEDCVSLEGEMPLILARFQQASVDLAYSMDRLRVGASMSALEVEDDLEGGRRGERVLLARSSLTTAVSSTCHATVEPQHAYPSSSTHPPLSTTSLHNLHEGPNLEVSVSDQPATKEQTTEEVSDVEEDDDAFFDADEGSEDVDGMSEGGRRVRTPRHSFSHSRPTSFTTQGHPSPNTHSPANPQHAEQDSHSHHSYLTPTHQQQQQEQLISLLFLTHSATSDRYEGVDMELRVKLAALHFTARRPTVACLITVGGDMASIYAASPMAQVEALPVQPDPSVSSTHQTNQSREETQQAVISPSSGGVVVRSGGESRTLVRLHLEMRALELDLEYEDNTLGDSPAAPLRTTSLAPLLSTSVSNFSFTVDMHPTTMDVNASLGDCVARHGALGPDNPYITIASLRPGTSGSVITLQFRILSSDQSYLEPRVPDGYPYYTLAAHLSAVQLVFLNSFVTELMAYLTDMLAMQLPVLMLSAAPHSSSPAPAATSLDATSTTAPMLMLLDITADAPVIIMPESSHNPSFVELDLGHMALSNTINWGAAGDGMAVMSDDMQLSLTELSVTVGTMGGSQGENLIKQLGSGFQIKICRPLTQSPHLNNALYTTQAFLSPAPLPPMTVAVSIPELTAVVVDTEYKRLLLVLSTNLAEVPTLPPPAAWVLEHFSSSTSTTKLSTGPAHASTIPVSGAASFQQQQQQQQQAQRSQPASERDFTCSLSQVLSSLHDHLTMKATVSIGRAQLQLWVESQEAAHAPHPLTSIGLADTWVMYSATAGGHSFVSLQLPTATIADLRPGVPSGQSLVLSTADVDSSDSISSSTFSSPEQLGTGVGGYLSRFQEGGALTPSLLTMEYRSFVGSGGAGTGGVCAAQCVRMRLQQPTLVLDAAFLMTLLNFVAPMPMLQGPVPIPYSSPEIYLTAAPFTATNDVWLSPEFRLIADAPFVPCFEYDGFHTRLILPKGIPSSESLPLIVVGAGKTLTLRNVSIVNSASLAAVLHLGVGAQLIAREEDGVRLVPHSKVEDDYSRYLLLANGDGSRRTSGAIAATASSAALLEVTVDALGANLHIVDQTDADNSGSSSSQSLILPGVISSPSSRTASHHMGDLINLSMTRKDLAMMSSTTLSPSLSKSASYALLDSVGDGNNSGRIAGQPVNRTASLLSDNPGGAHRLPSQLLSSRPGTPQGGGASAGAAQQKQQPRVFRRVAVMMDLSAAYSADALGRQSASASIAGLAIKTHTSFSGDVGSARSGQGLPRDGSMLDPSLGSQLGDGAGATRSAGGPRTGPLSSSPLLSLHNTILEPCDLRFSYSLIPGTSQQLDLSISALALKLSPHVLQQLLQLQTAITAPLMVPPSHAPLLRCELFERVWTSQRTHGPISKSLVSSPSAARVAADVASSIGSRNSTASGHHGVDAMAAERGVTVWRPTAPSGYVILGDVVTAGSAQPQSQVAVVAVNSGLIAHPLGYTLVWSFEGGAVWRPIPPPHYVSMGCVTTTDTEPPSVRLVGCVHERVVVEAALGSCLLMCAFGNLWGVSNVGCTFEVSEAERNTPKAQLYDLRSPLSVPPAALHPQSLSAALPQAKPQPSSFARATSTPVTTSSLSSHPPPSSSPSAPLLKPTLPSVLPDLPGLNQQAPFPISGHKFNLENIPTPMFTSSTAPQLQQFLPSLARLPSLQRPSYSFKLQQQHLQLQATPVSLLAQHRFLQQRDELIAAVTGQRSVATCVEFERLWWDKGVGSNGSTGISFWRPITPPGYMSLGDCMVVGIYAPPRGVMVLRGSDPGSVLSGGGPPLLAMPMQYERIWPRPSAGSLDSTTLCLWRPVAPPGYVAVGSVVTLGSEAPAHSLVRCVRADSVDPLPLGKLAPAWRRPNLRAWITDPRTCAFMVALNDSPPSQSASATAAQAAAQSTAIVYIIRADAARASGRNLASAASQKASAGLKVVGTGGGGGVQSSAVMQGAVAPPLSMDLRVTRVSLLLRSNRSVPLMEVEAGEVTMNYVEKDVGIMKCIISMWSYNLLLAAWEPIIEPWQLLLQLDSNCQPGGSGSGKVSRSAGGGGGTSLRLTSTQDNVQVAVAYAALAALLEAAPDWLQADGSSPSSSSFNGKHHRELSAIESNTMTALVNNALGVPAKMLLDWGDHQEVVDLAPGVSRQVAQPLPYRAPSSHHRRDASQGSSNSAAAAAATSLDALVPCVRLLVDVLQCSSTESGGSEPLNDECGLPIGIPLSITVQLSGPLAPLMPESSWGLTSRRVPLSQSTSLSHCRAEWNERFILKLPSALSRQLLQPKSTPGGLSSFSGTLLNLQTKLEGPSVQGAVGSVLGSVDIPVLSDWVGNEVLKLLAQAHGGRPAAAPTLLGATSEAGMLVDVLLVPYCQSANGREGTDLGLRINAGVTHNALGLDSTVVRAGDSSPSPAVNSRSSAAGDGAPAGLRLKLRLSIDGSQVDSLWRPFLMQLGTANGSSSVNKADAALGRRALQLRGSDSWSPFPYGNRILSAVGGSGDTLASGSVIPIPLQPYGAVLDSSLGSGGVRRETLRSLFQFVNTTQLVLEVCLIKMEGSLGSGPQGGWTMLQRWSGSECSESSDPATLHQPKQKPAPTIEDAVVFEHQRFIMLRGWSHMNLLPTDRNRYSQYLDGSDSRDSFPQVPLSPGWEWEGVWQVEKSGNVDPEGWSYSFNWPQIRYPPLPAQAARKPTDFVRRRKWVRRRQLHIPAQGSNSNVVGSGEGGVRPASLESGSRRVLLGHVAPGDRLPLPYGWEGEGAELQVRPAVPQLPPGSDAVDNDGGSSVWGAGATTRTDESTDGGGFGSGVSHNWSRGNSSSGRSVDLTSLGSNPPAQLLCCSPVHTPAEAMLRQHLRTVHDLDPAFPVLDALRPCWLSIMLDHEVLNVGPGTDSNRAQMQDWRVTVRAPLCLENALPVAGFFQVFERKAWQPSKSTSNPMAPPGGPSTFAPITSLCAEGHIPAGGKVEVFSVDTRQQVHFTFRPDGCEWPHGADPVILSQGLTHSSAGVGDAPDLPNSFNCSYSHSSATTPLTIFFTRTLDTSLFTSPLGGLPVNSPGLSASKSTASSNSSSGPNQPSPSPSRIKVGRTLTPSEAVGSGYPLTVRMHVPLWVINSTAMPIRVAVAVKQEEPEDSGSSMFAELSSASGFLGLGSAGSQSGGMQRLGGGEGSNLASGGDGALPLYVVDTEAFKSTFRPRRFVCVAPNSVELISYNMGSELPHVLQLSIMDSKWTAPVPLPALDVLTGGRLAAAAAQGRGKKAPTTATGDSSPASGSTAGAPSFNSLEPWVIRSSQTGPVGSRPGMALDPALHETVARLNLGSGVGGLQHLVLRLEPHLVVSNRTGYLLGMLQPDSLGVPLGPLATGVTGSAAVAAGGFSPFNSLQNTLSSMKSGSLLSRASSTSSPSRTGSERSSGAQPMPAIGLSSMPWLQLPPGAVGLPVIWTRGSSQLNGRKMLSLCIPAMVGLVVPVGGSSAAPMQAAVSSQQQPLWSEPFSAEYPGGTHLQVVVPLYCLGKQGTYSNRPDQQLQQQQLQYQLQQHKSASISMTQGNSAVQPDLASRSMPGWPRAHPGVQMYGDSSSQMQVSSYDEAVAGVQAHLTKICGAGSGFMDSMIDLSDDSEEEQQPDNKTRYSHAPSLFRISRHTEKAGMVDFIAVVVEISLTLRSPGCLHLQLLSLGSEPAQLLLNATPTSLRYREAGYTSAVWSVLPAYSALGYARQHYPKSSIHVPLELEIRGCGSDEARGVEVSLGSLSAGGLTVGGVGGRGRGSKPRNPAPARANLTLGSSECLAQVSEVLQLVMSPVGLTLISGSTSGASLGSSRLDKTLRVVPHPPAIGPTGSSATAASIAASSAFASDMLLANSTGAGSSAGAVAGVQSMRVSLAVSGLELSIIDYSHSSSTDRVADHTPQELLVLSLTDLSVEYEAGVTAGVSWVQFHAQVRSAQLDDQLPGSIHPVMIRLQQADDNNSGASGFGTRLDSNRDPRVDPPMLMVTYVSQPNKQRGVLHCPCIAMRTSPLRVAVSEPIVWRLMQLMTMVQGCALVVEQMDGTAPAAREQVTADVPLQIGLLSLGEADLRLSFKTDAASRPVQSSAMLSLGLEFANLDDMRLTLPGMEMEGMRTPRSLLLTHITERLKERLFSIALSLIANYGIFGSTSRILAVASQGVAQLGDGGKSSTATPPIPGREVNDFGDGMLEGGRAFAGGFVDGISGLISKPIAGASKGGLVGFFGGVAQGIVGVAAAPISGTLAAASKLTEGLNASQKLVTNQIRGGRRFGKTRLARAIGGDGVLRPFSLEPALGQALLHSVSYTGSGGGGIKGPGQFIFAFDQQKLDFRGDAYEGHFCLPRDLVLIVTHLRLILLEAPEFITLQRDVLGSRETASHVTDIPQGEVLWQLPWHDILTLEPRPSQNPSLPADGIVIHRKNLEAPMQYTLTCRPNTLNAVQILSRIQEVRHTFYLLPRQLAAGWQQQQLLPSRPQGGQEQPDTILNSSWTHIWSAQTSGGFSGALSSAGAAMAMQGGSIGGARSAVLVSIWRPTGPDGYSLLGDVAFPGREPPGRPVRLYKDILNSDNDSQLERPRLQPPIGYRLVYRETGGPRPVTLWRPIPPQGYVEIGCVASRLIEEPPLGIVRCVRSDLASPSSCFTTPLWTGVSPDTQSPCSIWQVDNLAGTFLALKSHSTRPDAAQARKHCTDDTI